jgi:hypothetical protein
VNSDRVRLRLTASLTLACYVMVVIPFPVVVRMPAAIALLFAVPGYVLLQVSHLDRSRDPLERFVVILGVGTGFVLVVAVAIAASPLPLTGVIFATVLTLLILGGLIWAGLRMPTRREIAAIARMLPRTRPSLGGREIISAVSAQTLGSIAQTRRSPYLVRGAGWLTVATLALVALLIAGTNQQIAEPPIIELWMLPEAGGARVGIYNGTTDPVEYRLVIGPRRVAAESISIAVALGSKLTWQDRIAFPPGWLDTGPVDATLYTSGGGAQPIRTVWIDPAAASP